MAWNDFISTDLAADDSLSTSVGLWLVSRDRILTEIPVQVDYADTTTTSATYDPLITFVLREPDYCGSGFYLFHYPNAYISSAVAASLQLTTSANNGNEITVTQTGSAARISAPLEVLIEAPNAATTVTLSGKIAGGNTLHVSNFGGTTWVGDT
jgi:hypothetical protein